MKKSELIELIKEVIYGELPEIMLEIKESMASGSGQVVNEDYDGEAIRQRIRDVHGPRPSAPPGRNLLVDYKGEKVASGQGVLDWFKKEVSEGNVPPPGGGPAHSDGDMKDFMTKQFGKKIT